MTETPGLVQRPAHSTKPSYFNVDFNLTPYTVAWEITRACALACVHCRAEAIPRRDPRELSTEEGFRLIDQVVEIGRPILVITGGDPMMRRDVYDLLSYASARGLRVALSPSATRLVTHRALERVKACGTQMLHLSLDGASAEVHDRFRGVAGSYQRTLEILRDTQEVGLPLQIGTTVSRLNVGDLPALAEQVAAAGASVWSVFFLVPTGRGKAADLLTPEEHERVLEWLYDLSMQVPFHVRTVAAPHYRRVVLQKRGVRPSGGQTPRWELTGAGYAFRAGQVDSARGVNDGNGFCFVSHIGDVYPSGFLQLSAGNVREQPLAAIYRQSPLFRALRDETMLKGKCGVCEFKRICGGSRARAYALTGDYLASDPSCVYRPAAWARQNPHAVAAPEIDPSSQARYVPGDTSSRKYPTRDI